MSPLKRIIWWGGLILLIAGISCTPQSKLLAYCPGWPIKLEGEVLEYIQSAPNPAEIFGCPQTHIIPNPSKTDQEMIIFDRAKFDLTLTNNGVRIEKAPLGEWVFGTLKNVVPVRINKNITSCSKPDPTTDFQICQGFWDYYRQIHGEIYLGAPISEVLLGENGGYVQYFKYGRIEWYPNRGGLSTFRLGDLGLLYMKAFDIHEIKNATVENIIQFEVIAETEYSLLPAGSQQNVTVIVKKLSETEAISNAEVNAVIIWPDGISRKIDSIAPTNKFGITTFSFPVENFLPDSKIIIKVNVKKDLYSTQAQTWFRIWY